MISYLNTRSSQRQFWNNILPVQLLWLSVPLPLFRSFLFLGPEIGLPKYLMNIMNRSCLKDSTAKDAKGIKQGGSSPNGVFTLLDTKTDKETNKNGLF